ncbi:MAG TPA: molecular chaperone TorD family protein [Malonomonas sp.]
MNRQLSHAERASCYQILATLFCYPDKGLLDSLHSSLENLSLFLHLPIPVELKQTPELIDTEVAYTSLFINSLGGAAAPPYGSVYLESAAQLMGASCQQVSDSYRREGLNLDASEEPADFLATELEFLYFLVAEEAAAEDAEAAAVWKRKQADFSRKLLHPWLSVFCQRVKRSDAGHPLYRWAAEALLLFSESEQNYLSGISAG